MIDDNARNVTETIGIVVANVIAFGALILGLINDRRDRPRVVVTLQWDMEADVPGLNDGRRYAIIRAVNVGRRPVYVSHAHVMIKGNTVKLLVQESVKGITLAEGDPPVIFSVIQGQSLVDYSSLWQKMYAVIIDSAGKEYKSQRTKIKPSWVKTL